MRADLDRTACETSLAERVWFEEALQEYPEALRNFLSLRAEVVDHRERCPRREAKLRDEKRELRDELDAANATIRQQVAEIRRLQAETGVRA